MDVWFSADEAKRWGFVDAVYDGNAAGLLAAAPNLARRKRMLTVLRQPIHAMTKVF
jgi:enoyl-CoA hydratase/carnithine racemase